MRDKPAEKNKKTKKKEMLWMTLKYNYHSSNVSSCIKNCDNYFRFLWVNVGHCKGSAFQLLSRYNTSNIIYNYTINMILIAS